MADLEINVKEIKQKIAPRYTDGVAGNDLNTLLLMHFDEETATLLWRLCPKRPILKMRKPLFGPFFQEVRT